MRFHLIKRLNLSHLFPILMREILDFFKNRQTILIKSASLLLQNFLISCFFVSMLQSGYFEFPELNKISYKYDIQGGTRC